jgi:ABC-type branched-subunit amino acid transport system ATPase component
VLAANGLTKRYGGIVAVSDVTLRVAAGEVCGLIGPNGG